jgi:hypothetical protein
VALASFPGSGNTWVRYLLQQVTGKSNRNTVKLTTDVCFKKLCYGITTHVDFYIVQGFPDFITPIPSKIGKHDIVLKICFFFPENSSLMCPISDTHIKLARTSQPINLNRQNKRSYCKINKCNIM